MKGLKIVTIVIFLLSCGKEMVPPSPDRWAPKLNYVKSENRRHLTLHFAEPMDKKSAEDISNYLCFETISGYTLELISASLKKDTREIDVTTFLQSNIEYTLVISNIKDVAGNPAAAKKNFKGKIIPDEKPPKIDYTIPAHRTKNFKTGEWITVKFLEPMDTVSVRENIFLLPTLMDLKISYEPGMKSFKFNSDVWEREELYTLYIKDFCTDIEGNKLESPLCIALTADSILPQGCISGEIEVEGEFKKFVFAIDSLDNIKRIVIVEGIEYEIDLLKPGSYRIVALTDTNGDRSFDLCGELKWIEVTDRPERNKDILLRERKKTEEFERLESLFLENADYRRFRQ